MGEHQSEIQLIDLILYIILLMDNIIIIHFTKNGHLI